jgi:adenylate cyclase
MASTLKPVIALAVSRRGANPFEHTFCGESFVAGRAHDCQLVLDDQYVSSRHFQIEWDGSQFLFKDLDSSNGSWINGARVQEAALREGDVINVGETQVTIARVGTQRASGVIEPTIDQTVSPQFEGQPSDSGLLFHQSLERLSTDIQALWKEHEALLRPFDDISTVKTRDEVLRVHQRMRTLLGSVETSLGALGRDHARLKALHSAIAQINRVTDLQGRLDAILNAAVDVMEADCGFVILWDEKTQRISVAIQRGMRVFEESGEVDSLVARSAMPSLSIAREVLATRRSIMASDIRTDGKFDSSQSVMMQGVVGVLCSPMIFDDELIGLIYVDYRNATEGPYRVMGPGDKELFEALASLAATAIQNAKFFRDVQIEVARRSSLERYLSPELVEQVMREDRSINLAAVRRHSAVLFCDIRGFTSFAESTAPDQLIRQLNQYFSAMLQAISAEGGSVDKFLGDGVMAFFGPLIELENAEIAGVRAAREMQRLMTGINETWRQQGWTGFPIGISVSAGEVVAGNLGSQQRLEYTVIGDTVNVASRLSVAAKPGQILVTRPVADRLPPAEFDVRPLDPLMVKGRTGEVEVFDVGY